MKKAILLGLAGSVAAGSIEISSTDLASPQLAYDNIKGSWSQGVKLFGRAMNVNAEYDRNERQDFLKQVSVNGALDKVKYELTSRFGGAADLKLETSTDDGTNFEVESELSDLHLKVTKVTASRSGFEVRGQNYDLELSHALGPNESKLKLSSALGKGVTAIGSLTSRGKDTSMAYEFEYETDLTNGRTLSASVKPQDGSGEVEYVDSVSVDGTITANIPLGAKPTVKYSRSWSF